MFQSLAKKMENYIYVDYQLGFDFFFFFFFYQRIPKSFQDTNGLSLGLNFAN